jgi:hypothetical protein
MFELALPSCQVGGSDSSPQFVSGSVFLTTDSGDIDELACDFRRPLSHGPFTFIYPSGHGDITGQLGTIDSPIIGYLALSV